MTVITKHHHLDKRADQILTAASWNDDDLLSTRQQASWFGVSEQWLEIGRVRGYGPPFVKLSNKMIKYRVGDSRRWLDERRHVSTREYA